MFCRGGSSSNVLLGFLTAASPSFRKKMSTSNNNNQTDSKGTGMMSLYHVMITWCMCCVDVPDYDYLSQQPQIGQTLGLPTFHHSMSQPPMDDSVFNATIGSPPPNYISTTPITGSYDLTLEELGRWDHMTTKISLILYSGKVSRRKHWRIQLFGLFGVQNFGKFSSP